MQAKQDFVSSLVALALILGWLWLTVSIDLSFSSDLETFSGPRAYPRVLLGLALVFNLVILGRAWLQWRAAAGEPQDEVSTPGRGKVVAAAAVLIAFVLLLEPAGYILTMLPLLIAVAWLFGARRPVIVIGVSLLLMLTCLVAFRFGLNTVLPEGIFAIDTLV